MTLCKIFRDVDTVTLQVRVDLQINKCLGFWFYQVNTFLFLVRYLQEMAQCVYSICARHTCTHAHLHAVVPLNGLLSVLLY